MSVSVPNFPFDMDVILCASACRAGQIFSIIVYHSRAVQDNRPHIMKACRLASLVCNYDVINS